MHVTLTSIDWAVIVGYALFALTVGLVMRKRASRSIDEYFLSGRTLPWWLAGTSMVATSFAADTPLLVSGWVREFGIWKNWVWWCQAISGAISVFVFARWWRRGNVMTKAELTELRYSGPASQLLRAFLGILHALIVNTMVLCWVLLAATKIFDVLFGVSKGTALVTASCIAMSYSMLSGFWGVVITDLFQFAISILGAILLARYCWDAVGGSTGIQQAVADGTVFGHDTLSFMPPPGPGTPWEGSFWTVDAAAMAIYLTVMWWALETVDGGGHSIQRICASRDERQGMLGTLWYTIAHYSIRPWPWLVVGIASLIILPRLEVRTPVAGTIEAIRAEDDTVTIRTSDDELVEVPLVRFADDWRTDKMLVHVDEQVQIDEVIARSDPEEAYIVMLSRYLQPGLRGLVVASLLAAFMSTIDTHVNLASSFFINDIYRRFIRPDASAPHYVLAARLASLAVMMLSALIAMQSDAISQVFLFFLSFLAGVGPVYVLRWFWWRVSAWTEIVALVTSGVTATVLTHWDHNWQLGPLSVDGQLQPEGRTLLVAVISIIACAVSLLVAPTRDPRELINFYRTVRPLGWWGPVRAHVDRLPPPESIGPPLVGSVGSIALIYGSLLGIGCWLLDKPGGTLALIAVGLGLVTVAWSLYHLPLTEDS